ncbi:OmpA family protein [Sulfidibacter corallicola]|uniref:OmpA family protein n=1 Tax=Sulfidibacter corallicola TaxID=2818388 RepID=A0A8A4TYH1_SULCO|nr:OmpA family protein [Sulfidibacter corallicola]QTD54134.1 OmpA family protein [Sulfidibacter corallicola]
MIRRRTEALGEEDQPNFWAAYSDLMAGVLFVFILLVIVMLFQYGQFVREKERRIDVQRKRLSSFHTVQMDLTMELERALLTEQVRIDPQTGVLQIGSGILFGEGQAELSDQGKRQLANIFRAYIEVVLSDRFHPFIKQIEIEGHTNSHGTYLYNLELSQRRALAVMQEFLIHAGDQEKRLQEMVVASGRSYAHLIHDESGKEDAVRSRRIEIRCRLKEAELFRQIYRDLNEETQR